MNPGSQGEKVALVQVLNEAELDPLTGMFDRNRERDLIWIKDDTRGRYCSPLALFDPLVGDRQEGYQSRCTELLFQDRWSFHWRDQVHFLVFIHLRYILTGGDHLALRNL